MIIEFIVQYWVDFAMLAISGVITYLARRIIFILRQINAARSGIRVLLRYRIIQTYNYYQSHGHMPISEMESVAELFEEYKKLGGGGVAADLMDRMSKFPTE